MKVHLAYGKQGLDVDFPDTAGFGGVLRGKEAPAIGEPDKAYEVALSEPIESPSLAQRIRARVDQSGEETQAVVVISDITRPVPNQFLLPPILKTLEVQGLSREHITILIGTGTHRPNEGEELVALVGPEIAEKYHFVNHRAKHDEEMTDCGKTSKGIPIFINQTYTQADIKIVTGFIEPHMWGGYSGGRKGILPGIASMETMKYMHGYAMVADPGTRYGRLEGNPFHDAGLEVLEMVGADFLVNVTMDNAKKITGFWCGDPVAAHLQGCAFLADFCQITLAEPLDFVITTNGGAPLDCNLYQSVKGITGAAAVVREGGTIVAASACPEGIGTPEYAKLVEGIESPESFLERIQTPGFFVPDQWCAQEMWQILLSKEIRLMTDGLSDDWMTARGLLPVADIADCVEELLDRYGAEAHWAVIPEGPFTITRLERQLA